MTDTSPKTAPALSATTRLIAYRLGEVPLELRPAPRRRDWMDTTSRQYAYRCLPLAIANQHAWEILCPVPFEASWRRTSRTEPSPTGWGPPSRVRSDGRAPEVA
jgi:hypothetical protein